MGQAKYKLRRNGENAPQKYPLELTCKSIKCYLISFNAFSWMRKIATKEMSRSRISLGTISLLKRKPTRPTQNYRYTEHNRPGKIKFSLFPNLPTSIDDAQQHNDVFWQSNEARPFNGTFIFLEPYEKKMLIVSLYNQ